jgi:hypothetical protein
VRVAPAYLRKTIIRANQFSAFMTATRNVVRTESDLRSGRGGGGPMPAASTVPEAAKLRIVDTIVIPAHEKGFENVFMRQRCWWPAPPIQRKLVAKIRYIAVYRAAPVSAITHYALITRIEALPDSIKTIIKFSRPKKIGPLRYVPGGQVKPVQGRRYTVLAKLREAKTLDDAF